MSNFRGTAYSNKQVKRREQERIMGFHNDQLKNARPLTSNLTALDSVPINNKKKEKNSFLCPKAAFTETLIF